MFKSKCTGTVLLLLKIVEKYNERVKMECMLLENVEIKSLTSLKFIYIAVTKIIQRA